MEAKFFFTNKERTSQTNRQKFNVKIAKNIECAERKKHILYLFKLSVQIYS